MVRIFSVCLIALLLVGCASAPEVKTYPVRPVVPAANQSITVDNVVILLDASSSMGQADKFPLAKTLADMLVNALPQGGYQAGLIVFGGKDTQAFPFEAFDRIELETKIKNTFFLGGVSSFESQIMQLDSLLKNASGKTAVFYFSDGRPININDALDSFAQLAKNSNSDVCLHCVQIGFASGAQPFLQELAQTTSCGSYRQDQSIHNIEGMQSFVRAVMFGN